MPIAVGLVESSTFELGVFCVIQSSLKASESESVLIPIILSFSKTQPPYQMSHVTQNITHKDSEGKADIL